MVAPARTSASTRADRDAERRAAHDPLFRDGDKRRFGIDLSNLGHRYKALADELEYLHLPRPSGGNAAWRELILATARDYRDARDLAYRLAELYRPARHLPASLPVEDGYLVALLADAPVPAPIPTCAGATLPASYATHCAGERITLFHCFPPDLTPAGGDCAELEAA